MFTEELIKINFRSFIISKIHKVILFLIEMSSFTTIFDLYNSNRVRKGIPKGTKDIVWIKYMENKTQGKCYCCGIKPIHFTDFEVGHNKSVYLGGDKSH